jgi:hypothetical protein
VRRRGVSLPMRDTVSAVTGIGRAGGIAGCSAAAGVTISVRVVGGWRGAGAT